MGLDGCSSLKPLLRATGPTRKGHRTAQDLVERYPDTAAAMKAAKRLKMIDEAS